MQHPPKKCQSQTAVQNSHGPTSGHLHSPVHYIRPHEVLYSRFDLLSIMEYLLWILIEHQCQTRSRLHSHSHLISLSLCSIVKARSSSFKLGLSRVEVDIDGIKALFAQTPFKHGIAVDPKPLTFDIFAPSEPLCNQKHKEHQQWSDGVKWSNTEHSKCR